MLDCIRIIKSQDPALSKILQRQSNWEEHSARVNGIISSVCYEGDVALCRFTLEFDGVKLSPGELKVGTEEQKEAYRQVDAHFRDALRLAKNNITAFHQKQLVNSWLDLDEQGVVRGQIIRPLNRVGIYVPGGRADYPSSVLMNAIPAVVAGVAEIVLVTPPGPGGKISPYALVAAAEAGVTEIYRIGGAQAVAALAYGTESIKAVDKIAGPGNIFVTLAKRYVFGQVDIDMLAGPSEVAIVADATVDPVYVAADLLSQAEHDPLAAAILFTPLVSLAQEVKKALADQLGTLSREKIAAQALSANGAIVITGDLEEAFRLVNDYAPEHCELLVAEPFNWLSKIKNAGAVFLGPYSPEPAGDYLAGPNHVLPTGGTARWASGLGVHDFLKRTNVLAYSRQALSSNGPHIIKLARTEGLDAHARAVEVRLKGGLSGDL